jgi:lichenan operon transcriptional antiterminator
LDIQSKRILKILELFDIEKKVLDSASMAALIGVSSRTIRH